MSGIDKEQVQAQLDEWRGKLDMLRVKAHLLKTEYQDKPIEAQEAVEEAYAKAKAKFLEMKDAGGEQADKLGGGFAAAWAAFKETYDGVTEDE